MHLNRVGFQTCSTHTSSSYFDNSDVDADIFWEKNLSPKTPSSSYMLKIIYICIWWHWKYIELHIKHIFHLTLYITSWNNLRNSLCSPTDVSISDVDLEGSSWTTDLPPLQGIIAQTPRAKWASSSDYCSETQISTWDCLMPHSILKHWRSEEVKHLPGSLVEAVYSHQQSFYSESPNSQTGTGEVCRFVFCILFAPLGRAVPEGLGCNGMGLYLAAVLYGCHDYFIMLWWKPYTNMIIITVRMLWANSWVSFKQITRKKKGWARLAKGLDAVANRTAILCNGELGRLQCTDCHGSHSKVKSFQQEHYIFQALSSAPNLLSLHAVAINYI